MKTCYPKNSTDVYFLITIWENNYQFVIYRCNFDNTNICQLVHTYTVKKCPSTNSN